MSRLVPSASSLVGVLLVFAGVQAQAPAEGTFDLMAALRGGEKTMTVDEVAERALATSPTLERARAVQTQAREVADGAALAVYPRLDLEARYTRLSDEDPAVFSGFAAPTPLLDQYLLGARLRYGLSDLFFDTLPRIRAAEGTADAEGLRERAERRSVDLAARESFYEYARTRATCEVARAGLAQSETQRNDVRIRVEGGTLAQVELLRAEAQVAAARVALARAEGNVAVARTLLRSLLHEEGEMDIGIGEDLLAPNPPIAETKEALFARAQRERAELQALRKLSDAQDETVSANSADQLPDLSLEATYDFANPNLQRATIDERAWNDSWTVSGVLRWSPNDFVLGSARVSSARAERAQTLADIGIFEDALRREIDRAFEAARAAEAALIAARTGIVAAEESYRVRREQFRAGLAVATDLVDAESELRRARLELVNAAIDARIARARLDRAVER